MCNRTRSFEMQRWLRGKSRSASRRRKRERQHSNKGFRSTLIGGYLDSCIGIKAATLYVYRKCIVASRFLHQVCIAKQTCHLYFPVGYNHLIFVADKVLSLTESGEGDSSVCIHLAILDGNLAQPLPFPVGMPTLTCSPCFKAYDLTCKPTLP
jgi:hypothetical protein